MLVATNTKIISFRDPIVKDAVKESKSIQIISEGQSDLVRNIMHLLSHDFGMKFVIHAPLVHDVNEFLHVFSHFCGAGLARYAKINERIVMVVTIKLSTDARAELERSVGKVIYLYDKNGINNNTDCDLTFASIKGTDEVMMLPKHSIGHVCKIETHMTHRSIHAAYQINEIYKSIGEIKMTESVFVSTSDKLYTKLWKKYYFLRKCIMIQLYLSHLGIVRDIVALVIQIVIATNRKVADANDCAASVLAEKN